MTTDSYRRTTKNAAEARPVGPGFAPVLILSVATTAALLIGAVVYWMSAPQRIASSYTVIASPANRALTAELAAYKTTRTHDLVAARSDFAEGREYGLLG